MDAGLTPAAGGVGDREGQLCRVRGELTELLHRYAALIDGRDWDGLATVFAPDAVADLGVLGGRVPGRHAIGEHCRAALERFAATQHLIGNVRIISWEGVDATTACSFVAVHVHSDGSAPFLVGGTYEDDLRRTPDGWRITRRELRVIWRSGREPGSLVPGTPVDRTQG